MNNDGLDITVVYQDWSDKNDPYHKENFCQFQVQTDVDEGIEVLDCYLVRNSKTKKTLHFQFDKTQALKLRDYLINEFDLDQFPVGK